MHLASNTCQLQLRSYKILLPLLILALLGTFAGKAFFLLHQAKRNYQAVLKQCEVAKKPLSLKELQKLKVDTERYSSSVEKLSDAFKKYQILLPPELLNVTPEGFQDQLQQDVSAIQKEAAHASVTLPSHFFLGLNEYEERPPSLEKIIIAMKQEMRLRWIAHQICLYPTLQLNQFLLEKRTPSKNQQTHFSSDDIGYLILSITTSESSFQKLFNAIINSPYCFVIESMIIENSTKNGPPHSLDNSESIIKVLFGYEKLTVIMKLQLLDFPS